MYIHGSYNSQTARLMNIQLMRCSEEDEKELGIKCKSPQEIKKFMKNKFFYLLYNQRRFDSQRYNEDSVVPESKGIWLPINTHF